MFPVPLRENAELTLLSLDDAPDLFALVDKNRDRLGEFLPWVDSTQSADDVAAFLNSARTQLDAGLGFHAAIRLAGRASGCIGLHPIDRANRSASVGYWIDRDAEGQGLVTLAAAAVVRICFEHYGLNRVEIRCATHNHRSRAVPMRLRFREEGLLRGAQLVRGRYLDQYLFAKLATDGETP